LGGMAIGIAVRMVFDEWMKLERKNK
jgi:hypothetical protein